MIAILDESAPVRLANALARTGTRVLRFPRDWKGLRNGELLSRMRESGFCCLITCDKNMIHQQNVSRSGIAVVVLPRQRFEDLRPILNPIARAIHSVEPGNVLHVHVDGTLVKA